MENMGYREGSSKLSKHRRMSRAASLAVEAGEGIPLSRYKAINVKSTTTKKEHASAISFSICFVRVWLTYLFYTSQLVFHFSCVSQTKRFQ